MPSRADDKDTPLRRHLAEGGELGSNILSQEFASLRSASPISFGRQQVRARSKAFEGGAGTLDLQARRRRIAKLAESGSKMRASPS
jgi:hypothetical protein